LLQQRVFIVGQVLREQARKKPRFNESQHYTSLPYSGQGTRIISSAQAHALSHRRR
jgi:hypothetical protein